MKPLRIVDLAAPLRSGGCCEGLIASFPDRWGGVSETPFNSLNLGFSTGDDPAAVRENRRRFAEAAAISLEHVVVAGQCHGSEVAEVGLQHRGEGALAPSARLAGRDVVVLTEPGVFALSLTADCPLVAIADPLTRRAGVAHCGWRGTAEGALMRLLEVLEPGPEALAILSPAISGEKYRVGPEVHQALAGLPGAEAAVRDEGIDLRTVLREQLLRGGVESDRIALDVRCSASDGDLFSYRRDQGSTGRGGLLIGWKF